MTSPSTPFTDDAQISGAFSGGDLIVLQASEVTQSDMIRLANLEPKVRLTALNHIAGGETASRAIELAQAQAAEPPKPPTEADLPDADWLATCCSTIRQQIQDPTSFDKNALAYRHTRDARRVLRMDRDVKAVLADWGGRGYEPFLRKFYEALYADHPDRWSLCAACGGHNVARPDCGTCAGKGYTLTFQAKKATPANG